MIGFKPHAERSKITSFRWRGNRGIGVVVNRPFREGELLRKIERHPLPG